jgi:hypothetical protein
MSLLDTLLARLKWPSAGVESAPDTQAGPGQLPSPQSPKPPTKATALPSFKTQVARQEAALQRPDKRLANTDITTFRNGADTRAVIRDYLAASPDLSATKSSYLRVGIPERFTVIGRDLDGAINPECTKLAHEILRRVTFLGDPSLGYNPVTDLQSLSESLAQEGLAYGSMGLELALDKMRTPTFLQAVSVTKIQFKEEDGGVYPIQVIGGEERKLDIPTFFYVSIDQDLLSAYSSSYFEAAIQSVIADAQFLNDIRRSMQRVIQPRLVATIVEEKVKQSIPPDILNDPTKLGTFYNELITAINNTLSGLQPEDALVAFDSVEYSMLGSNGSQQKISDTLEAVQKILESKLAAGAKTMPSVLGRGEGASAATTSTMLFLKNADIIRRKLNLLYSRALTMAVRLQGQDCYVEFRYDNIDLRPEGELEAYKAMKQSRVLELLSLGLISDEEACIELTGNLPRDGHTPLAGTMFKNGTATSANPNSQTSNMGGAPDDLKPTTPAKPKGQK